MCDVPVVAGGARNRGAGLSAVLREGGGGSGAMHGVERTAQDAGHDLPKVVKMGETLMSRRGHFFAFQACQNTNSFVSILPHEALG